MIGGNIQVLLQKGTTIKNEIGEPVQTWEDVQKLTGWLDLSSGDSKHTTYNAKIQESTHVFICDYTEIKAETENARMVAKSGIYDVLLIDNPMELNRQIEIYLKYTGGQ